jgi:Mg-chelatase subunit ChlD
MDRLRRALANSPPPAGSTDIGRAITVADTEMASTARAEAVGVIVLLTDGQSNAESMLKAADRAKQRGTVIFTIGLGVDASQDALRRAASSPGHYDFAPGPEALAAVYQRVANIIRTFTVTDAHLLHSPLAGIEYLAGSGQPAEPQTGATLDWRQPFLPPDGITVTYQVRLTRTGQQDLGPAWAQYVDGDGVLRRFDYPALSVNVVPPVIRSYYLPGLYRNQCVAAARHADVAIALDTSNSMLEDGKLGEAVAAAKTFVGLLRLPADQAALVGFYGQAELLQPLTGDRALLESRLDNLTTHGGTRIDKGIDTAVAELLSPRHAEGNQRVLVLLSDGQQLEEPTLPAISAAFARRMGITVYAIALGSDADEATLRTVAGSPSRFFRAASTQDLGTIYTQIAGVVACR